MKDKPLLAIILLVLVAVVVAMFYSSMQSNEPRAVASPIGKPPAKATPEQQAAAKLEAEKRAAQQTKAFREAVLRENKLQEQRARLLRKYISAGLIKELNYPGGDLPHLWVRPAFYGLDFDDKQALCNLALTYAHRGKPGPEAILVLRDSQSGRRVGSFTSRGLELQ